MFARNLVLMKTTTGFAILSFVLVGGTTTYADTFGSDPNSTFDIEFVTIGNPGNPADATGDPNSAGSVPYEYRIGKFEISEGMIDKANSETAGDPTPLNLNHDNRGPNKPATSISWFEAAQFVNWLNIDSGSMPAYKFDGVGNFQLWQPADAGYNPNNLYRNSLAKYVLPSVDEWYKAAFYDPTAGVYYDYPTGSDTPPTAVTSGTAADTAVYDQSLATGPADVTLAGGLSPYGTAGQGGNVNEWEETDFDLVNDSTSSGRGVRGGGWSFNSFGLLSSNRTGVVPSNGVFLIGFRVASIPEPSADFDEDDSVDGFDFLAWQLGFGIISGATKSQGDADNNGTVDDADLAVWELQYGTVAPLSATSATTVPEPSSVLLGAMASMGLLFRRRCLTR